MIGDNELSEKRMLQLRAAEEIARKRLDVIFESSPVAHMLLEANGIVRAWSDACVRMTGFTRDEAVGRFNPIVPPDRVDEFKHSLARIIVGARFADQPALRRRKDGALIEIEMSAASVPAEHGGLQVLAIVVDVTERNRNDARQRFLAEAGAVLADARDPERSFDARAVLGRLAALAVSSFADWCFVHVVADDGALERAAIAYSDPSYADAARALPSRASPCTDARIGIAAAIETGLPQLIADVDDPTFAQTAADAQTVAGLRSLGVRSSISAPLVVSGRVLGTICFASCRRRYDGADVAFVAEVARRLALTLENARLAAERKATLTRLIDLQALTSALSKARTPEEVSHAAATLGARALGAGSCTIWMKHDDALHVVANLGPPEWHIEPYRVLPLHRRDLPAVRVVETGEPEWVESVDAYRANAPRAYELARSNDRVRAFCALPLCDGDTRIGCVVFAYDIDTKRFTHDDKQLAATIARQCEQALVRAQLYEAEARARRAAEEAREQAQEASGAKDEFLAMLGHELRNPLAPIVTALQLMKMRGTPGAERERGVIERQAQHLVRLVDDLLDVSRITRGKVELKKQPIDVKDVVAQAVEMVQPLIESRAHELVVDVPGGLVVEADPARLAQVLSNLLANAARYTKPHGHVVIAAVSVDGRATITVRDDGIGLSPALLPKVFDLFVQGDRKLDRAEGGLGIGLAVVKSLVELHGGTVRADSAGLDQGASFTVTLPLVQQRELSLADHAAKKCFAKSVRVLIVDDNVDAAELLGELLSSSGHNVAIADDGPSALAVAAQHRPTVALVDIGLPVMSGFEVAVRLREMRDLHPLRLVAVTGYGQPADIEQSKRAGFDAHLVKPVDVAVLDRILAEAAAFIR